MTPADSTATATHTPGPWAWDSRNNNDYLVSTSIAQCVLGFPGVGRFLPRDERGDLDALLIAAAPDLLAALKAMLDQPETPESYNAMMQRAHDAIAKAEGR